MIKRILLSQLRVGMFIECVEGSILSAPITERRLTLQSKEIIETLQRSNLSGVFINTAKGLDIAPLSDGDCANGREGRLLKHKKLSRPSRKYRSELVAVAQAITHTADRLKDIFIGAKADGPSVDAVAPLAAQIAKSMERSPSIWIRFTRLKSADETTYLHSIAVSAFMIQFARYLKMDEDEVHFLGISGLLHDIGKIAIPVALIKKAGALTKSEMDVMRTHPVFGHELLSRQPYMPDCVLDVCLHHHERLDGKGYPKGLAGEEISLHARMAAICDVYDAVTSVRPYKKPWSPAEAATWMLEREGYFDRKLLLQFLKGVMRT